MSMVVSGILAAQQMLVSRIAAISNFEKRRNRPPLEIYDNNPNETPEEDLITEICVLLQRS